MKKLIVLGTGAANTLHYYNTCFMLQGPQGGLLVDGGGGNGILVQLNKAGIPLTELTDLFVTHEHIDHSLGVIWLVRMISSLFLREKRSDIFRIHCHARLAEKLRSICQFTLSEKQFSPVGTSIRFVPVKDGEQRSIAGHTVTFFNTHSRKAEQYGFHMQDPNGQRIVCTGDEPCQPVCAHYLEGADWLFHEAFCLESDARIFRPHLIGHGTVREAALLARKQRVKNIVLWHTEDSATLGTRKERYTEEAASVFRGGIYIPDDLEEIELY
ncbi:MBL fold metallo-hydrolase [uncultured Mailhella sp.]|uniref:MBL fold metallo-hydrolase n=1 Tax=uncultured Mailhella sp. TaxID=1981031 RepID=UPI0025D727D6|nr:MBL fold metallo-hydrolase [uncultured Mailhella sp.]